MNLELFTLFSGFIEGFGLIISPCILPILPIVLASSFAGSKKRPLGVIIGFILSFALFAFFSRKLVQITGINLNWVRYFSYFLLVIFGLILFSSYLSEKFYQFTQQITRRFFHAIIFSRTPTPQDGFWSGVFLGSLIALIWTPCAGPILAAIIVQTVLQKTTLMSFFVLLAFSLGAAIPMFIIVFYGMKIVNTFPVFKTQAALFRKALAVIIIASVFSMVYLERAENASSILPQTTIKTASSLLGGLWHPYVAPDIEGIETWINSPPLSLSTLKGKVVLIDFWTYSCINCIRTLPYLKDWYTKYQNKGLVIIGIHAPEFDFEKNLDNVRAAVKRNGLFYPVALDNQFVTWINYKNHYWPAHYLINKAGKVVYEHFGEGQYGATENNIRYLLGIDDLSLIKDYASENFSFSQTPETYLGYDRADKSLSPFLIHDKIVAYTFPNELASNAWGLQGDWQAKAEKIISASPNAALKIHFNAAKVFIVMGNQTSKPIEVYLLLNGKPFMTNKGKDVRLSTIRVADHSIYELVNAKQFGSSILQITASSPGLEIYTFTFGT